MIDKIQLTLVVSKYKNVIKKYWVMMHDSNTSLTSTVAAAGIVYVHVTVMQSKFADQPCSMVPNKITSFHHRFISKYDQYQVYLHNMFRSGELPHPCTK